MVDNIIQIQEGNVSELTKDLAYHGAKDGSALLKRSDDKTELSIYKVLNGIPMGYIEGASFIATLAAVHVFEGKLEDIHITWPWTVKSNDEDICQISTSAGFKGELFAVISFVISADVSDDLIELLVDGVCRELESWRQAVCDKLILAGPVSQCLSEYFDYIHELGKSTLVQNPDGKLIYTGEFGGLDVWGHAIVVGEGNVEKTFAPNEAILICTE